MIISASRRTDIPAYYADWFCNRIREGYVCVRNPMNFHQVSRISLSPDVVDGIVILDQESAAADVPAERTAGIPVLFSVHPDPIRKRRGTGRTQQE